MICNWIIGGDGIAVCWRQRQSCPPVEPWRWGATNTRARIRTDAIINVVAWRRWARPCCCCCRFGPFLGGLLRWLAWQQPLFGLAHALLLRQLGWVLDLGRRRDVSRGWRVGPLFVASLKIVV